MWDELREWIAVLFPHLDLDTDPTTTILGWPSTPLLPPLLIHLHSVAVNSIYRVYCKIGDDENVHPDDLRWMVILSFQRRAKTELTRAQIKDTARANNPQLQPRNPFEDLDASRDASFEKMQKVWDLPPHVVVTKESVSFGDIWPRPPSAQDKDATPQVGGV